MGLPSRTRPRGSEALSSFFEQPVVEQVLAPPNAGPALLLVAIFAIGVGAFMFATTRNSGRNL